MDQELVCCCANGLHPVQCNEHSADALWLIYTRRLGMQSNPVADPSRCPRARDVCR